jgi:hypothetical protein
MTKSTEMHAYHMTMHKSSINLIKLVRGIFITLSSGEKKVKLAMRYTAFKTLHSPEKSLGL